MRDSLAHRGPDGYSSYFDNQTNLALGHRRLSIIDLTEKGQQPMSNEDGTVIITYNGEIYNYRELKSELQEKHTFKSNTDTEVLIHAYEEWGIEETLEKINGMFAFAIYVKNENAVICARDRIGIKPFVYHVSDNLFIFASEIKAITSSTLINKEIDYSGVYDYFLYRYIPYPRTIYKNIFKLEPGNYLRFDIEDFKCTKKTYWDIRDKKNQRSISVVEEKQIINRIERLLDNAVKKRLYADVKVETFLSGGIDSSLIAAMALKHNKMICGFSIKVDTPKKDELESAVFVAKKLGIDHKYKKLNSEMLNNICDKVIKKYDEPLGDTSIIPTYLLCAHTSQKAKVALSGDGGDELFYGYRWYDTYIEKKNEMEGDSYEVYRNIITRTFTFDEIDRLFNYRMKDRRKESSYVFRKRLKKAELRPEDLGVLDFLTFLIDDNLTRVDIASMANSLEVRVPYLDHELVEYILGIPYEIIYKNQIKKYLLKQVALNKLPEKTIHKPKKGFSSPTIGWLKRDYKRELLKGKAVADGILNRSTLVDILDNEKNEERLWLLYVFEKWYENNISEKDYSARTIITMIKNRIAIKKYVMHEYIKKIKETFKSLSRMQKKYLAVCNDK